MKNIKLTKTQKEQVEKAINGSTSLYKEFKGLLESDLDIRSLFLEKTAKEILITVYGDQVLERSEFALTENRQRTSLGNGIHNLKKLAKKLYGENQNNEKNDYKKCVNVCNDLDNIKINWNKYKDTEQNSIRHHLDELVKFLESLEEPKKKTTKK